MDTPLSHDGQHLAPERIAPLVRFLTERGVEGLFVAGSTGQGPLLDSAEWLALAEGVIAAADGAEVLVNISAPSTRETLERVRLACDMPLAAVVVQTPVAYAYEPRAVLAYFEEVLLAASPKPLYLYRKKGDPWGAADVEQLRSKHANLAGIKDSATDMELHLAFLRIPGIKVYQGYEALFAASALAGGAGTVSGLATVLPEMIVETARHIAQGSSDLWAVQARLTEVRHLVCGPNPYGAFKALLAKRGVDVGAPRRPILPFGAQETAALVDALRTYDVELE